ncbi:ATP-dependent RecD-like DNA helicase, partial [Lactobacillus salivarius]|nr:ATP-dependent RecD-like DNA helicase [Ligilactobacillus salivarius]
MSEELDLFAQEDNGKYLIGTVNAVYFEASDSFYKVLQVLIKETNFDWDDQKITVTGSFANIQTDSLYRFEGNVVEHQRYGKQFQAESYQLELPSTKDGVIAYLSSDEFVGIGKKTAEKIVKKLGVDAIDVLNNDMDKLEELGLSEKQKDSIKKVLKENYGIDKIIIELNSLGFTSTMAG